MGGRATAPPTRTEATYSLRERGKYKTSPPVARLCKVRGWPVNESSCCPGNVGRNLSCLGIHVTENVISAARDYKNNCVERSNHIDDA